MSLQNYKMSSLKDKHAALEEKKDDVKGEEKVVKKVVKKK